MVVVVTDIISGLWGYSQEGIQGVACSFIRLRSLEFEFRFFVLNNIPKGSRLLAGYLKFYHDQTIIHFLMAESAWSTYEMGSSSKLDRLWFCVCYEKSCCFSLGNCIDIMIFILGNLLRPMLNPWRCDLELFLFTDKSWEAGLNLPQKYG